MIEEKLHEQDDDEFIGPGELEAALEPPETPIEGPANFSDNFRLICDHVDIQPKSIILPKFIFSPSIGYREKGFLLLSYNGDHENGAYAKILKAAAAGFKFFEIQFLTPEKDVVISSWKFEEARIHAVDFGFVANERPSPAEFVVEVDYKHLNIDGTII